MISNLTVDLVCSHHKYGNKEGRKWNRVRKNRTVCSGSFIVYELRVERRTRFFFVVIRWLRGGHERDAVSGGGGAAGLVVGGFWKPSSSSLTWRSNILFLFLVTKRERERDINDFQKMKELISSSYFDWAVRKCQRHTSQVYRRRFFLYTHTERQRQVTSGFQHFLAVCPLHRGGKKVLPYILWRL